MHRDRIKELVYACKGLHKSRIGRELNLAWGQLSHHLAILSRLREIELEYHGQECWAFKPALSVNEKKIIVAAGPPWRQRLIGWLGGKGASTLTELSNDLEGSRKLIRHHLGHLMAAGVVSRSASKPPKYHLHKQREKG
jgi:predicted transcriptional regulator